MNMESMCNSVEGSLQLKKPLEEYTKKTIVTCNQAMLHQIEQLEKVAPSDVNIVIKGETGTGKELYAEFIHSMSSRKDKPFVKINCATISESLFESEMFGYTPGSFTGALKSGKKGIFEIANRGTIFLDEIPEMPKSIQPKFLRVLQENTFIKVGGYEEFNTNVRVIVATNKDLMALVSDGLFREDLYYRLNVIQVNLLPLRERKEDIILLAFYFLKAINHKYSFKRKYSPEVIKSFIDYYWPGNIRELQHMIERMVLLSKSDLLDDLALFENNLPVKNLIYEKKPDLYANISSVVEDNKLNQRSFKELVSEYERTLIIEHIARYGSLRKAAKALKAAPSTLSRKLSKPGRGPSD